MWGEPMEQALKNRYGEEAQDRPDFTAKAHHGKISVLRLGRPSKLTIDFRPFIRVEGVEPRDFRQQRIDLADARPSS